MKAIYFSGKTGDGKTATALGIGLKLQENGVKVSYFKPLGYQRGNVKVEDEDILLMREMFKLPFSSEIISPLKVSNHYLTTGLLRNSSNPLSRVEQAFESCSQGYDLVLIDGSLDPEAGYNQGLDDFTLAKHFQAAVIQVLRAEDDFQLDRTLLYNEIWQCRGVQVLGWIFNNISRPQWDKTKGVYKPIAEKHQIPILGIVPRQVEIASPTVAEFYNALHGEILAAHDRLDQPVEEVVIGTMTIESALSYLRRAPNKALITGGDRSDLALTALETSTSVIILTGGLYPDVRVLSRAEEKGVPVILVHEDTFTTVENLHTVYRSIHPRNTEAIRIIRENTEKYVQWELILSYLNS